MSHTLSLYPADCTDLILNPWVGVMWVTSSLANCFMSVVFPALSRPSSKILSSWSGWERNLRNKASKPCPAASYISLTLMKHWFTDEKNGNADLPFLIKKILVSLGRPEHWRARVTSSLFGSHVTVVTKLSVCLSVRINPLLCPYDALQYNVTYWSPRTSHVKPINFKVRHLTYVFNLVIEKWK